MENFNARDRSQSAVLGHHRLAIVGGTHLLPDGLLENGGIYLEDGRIAAIGSRADIEPHVGERDRVIDATGDTVIPGFIDAHAHPLSFGFSIQETRDVRYPKVSSIDELTRTVARMTDDAPPGQWVRGRGFDYEKYPEGRMPTRWDIDAVSEQNPVALVHSSGHFALANSAALCEAGIDDDIEDPESGRFVRDKQGRVTGMLLDSAMEGVLRSAIDVEGHGPNHNAFPAPLPELVDDLECALSAFAAAGVTTVVDAQTTARDMPVYLSTRDSGRMLIRVVCMYLSNHLKDLQDLGHSRPLGDDWFSTGPLKVYSDGALTGSTAMMSEPYANDPCSHGYPYWSSDRLSEIIGGAHRFGLQVGIHAQGDTAIGMCLDSIEHALTVHPRADHRHRLEHCGLPTPEQITKIKALGAIPICQPNFLYEFGESFRANLGVERATRLTPLATMLTSGIPVALSSDAPVSSHEPLRNIQTAVLRRSVGGADMGSNEEIPVLDAIRAYTWNSARSIFRETWCGALIPGYAADIVVLKGDLRSVPRERLSEVRIRHTLVDGETVYTDEATSKR